MHRSCTVSSTNPRTIVRPPKSLYIKFKHIFQFIAGCLAMIGMLCCQTQIAFAQQGDEPMEMKDRGET